VLLKKYYLLADTRLTAQHRSNKLIDEMGE